MKAVTSSAAKEQKESNARLLYNKRADGYFFAREGGFL
jgi:hypothetical protein